MKKTLKTQNEHKQKNVVSLLTQAYNIVYNKIIERTKGMKVMKKTYYLIIINKTNGLQDVEVGFSQQDVELVEKTKLKEGEECYTIPFDNLDELFSIYTTAKNDYEKSMVELDEIHQEFKKIAQENLETMLEVM